MMNTNRRVNYLPRETQPVQFQPTPAFVTVFGDGIDPLSMDWIRSALSRTKMQKSAVSLSELDMRTALRTVSDQCATARHVMVVAHSENSMQGLPGDESLQHTITFSEKRKEAILTKRLLQLLSKSDARSTNNQLPKLFVHLVGCEAGALRSQIEPGDPVWKSAYVLLYASKKTTSLDAVGSSVSAAIRYVDLCDRADQPVDPLKLFYIAGLRRSECMTLMGGNLQAPLVWHAPRSVSSLNDHTSLACLKGTEKDLQRFDTHVKRARPEERALIPDVSMREFLSARIMHGDADAVMNLVASHAELLNARSTTGMLPLTEAIDAGDIELVADLLEEGADPNLPDQDGNTALKVALDLRVKAAIPILLKHGARSDLEDQLSVLEAAVQEKNSEMLALLLKDGLGYSTAGLDRAALLARETGNHVLLGLLLQARHRTT